MIEHFLLIIESWSIEKIRLKIFANVSHIDHFPQLAQTRHNVERYPVEQNWWEKHLFEQTGRYTVPMVGTCSANQLSAKGPQKRRKPTRGYSRRLIKLATPPTGQPTNELLRSNPLTLSPNRIE